MIVETLAILRKAGRKFIDDNFVKKNSQLRLAFQHIFDVVNPDYLVIDHNTRNDLKVNTCLMPARKNKIKTVEGLRLVKGFTDIAINYLETAI